MVEKDMKERFLKIESAAEMIDVIIINVNLKNRSMIFCCIRKEKTEIRK